MTVPAVGPSTSEVESTILENEKKRQRSQTWLTQPIPVVKDEEYPDESESESETESSLTSSTSTITKALSTGQVVPSEQQPVTPAKAAVFEEKILVTQILTTPEPTPSSNTGLLNLISKPFKAVKNFFTNLFSSKQSNEQTPAVRPAPVFAAGIILNSTPTPTLTARKTQMVFEQGRFRARYLDGKKEFTPATDPAKRSAPIETKTEISASLFSKFIEFFLLGCGILPTKQPQTTPTWAKEKGLYLDVNGNYGLFFPKHIDYATGHTITETDVFTDPVAEFGRTNAEYLLSTQNQNIHASTRLR